MAKKIPKFTIGVVIPTLYRDSKVVYRCLRSLKKSLAEVNSEIILNVVIYNNEHPKESIPGLNTRKKKSPIHLYSHVNKGFVGAVNDSIQGYYTNYPCDWYLIINNDTVVRQDFFKRFLPYLRSKTSVISCQVSDGNHCESSGLRYRRNGLAFPAKARLSMNSETSLTTGTCFFISHREVKKQLSQFGYVLHPLYFAYAEDLELSLRVRQTGGTITILNSELITHSGSHTAKRGSKMQLYYGYRNLLLTIWLHWPTELVFMNIHYLLQGQLYVLGMLIYKQYWLLYPKIIWYLIKNRKTLNYCRTQYAGIRKNNRLSQYLT